MATTKKVLTNTLAQFLGKICTVIASFFVVKIISGYGTDFYGNYVTTYEFLAFFGIIADAGLFAIAVREMSKTPEKTKYILGNILAMRLFLILGATVLAGLLAQLVPSYAPIVKIGIWITGISMGLTIIAGTLSSVLQARMKIQYFSTSLVIGKIVLAGLIFYISQLVWATPDHLFLTFLGAGVISNIIFTFLVYYFTQKEISIKLNFDFDWWKKTFKVSLPYGIALILQTLYLRIDLILISIILGSSAIGVYGLSARVMESFLILGVFFGQAILPKIAAEESDSKKSSSTLAWGMENLLIFALPLLIGVYAFAPKIVTLLSSAEFVSTDSFFGADSALYILAPTLAFAFFNQLFSFSLVAKNQQNYLLKINAIALSLNVILNLVFLKTYGIIAAAISTTLCELLILILLFYKINQQFQLKVSLKNIFWIILGNTLILSEIFLTPLHKHLIMATVVCGVSYGVFVYLFWKKLRQPI